ncbi:MAG: SHOCT domain-containing protein [Chloroflexi bacterium]|nr:SHOCT domain-containing protein [Chloroflexota bacterium]
MATGSKRNARQQKWSVRQGRASDCGRRRIGVVGPPRETPLDILKARYARGELSTEQFEEMKRRLGDA